MRSPILSIVIANYNYGRFIKATLDSVFEQYDPRVEVIVVDGGSTDDSVNVIKQYADKIAWWISERDRGQSDAFNKGFAHCRGKYLTWLNADDILLSGALCRVLDEMERHPSCQWFAANTVYFNNDKTVNVITTQLGNFWPALLRVPGWMRANGPSTFFTRELFEKVGPIREDLRYVMDIDLWMRFDEAGARLRYIPGYVWGFRLHEESKTASSVSEGRKDQRFQEERTAIRKEHGVGACKEACAIWRKRIAGILSGGFAGRLLQMRCYAGKSIDLI